MLAALSLILILSYILIVTATDINLDAETTNFYCQLNEYTRLKIQGGENPFPCST